MRHANIIGGVAVLLLGLGTTVAAWRTLPYSGEFGPGPGFVPLWLGVVLVVCAIPIILADLRAKASAETWFRPETWQCVRVLALIVAVFLLLPVLGFSVGLALITGGGMRLMGKHAWVACALTAIGTAVCIHYLFGQWLSIPLPQGVIGW